MTARGTGRREAAREPALSDYVGFLRRHRWIIAAALAAGLLVGVVLVTVEQDTYTARVSVLTPAAAMNAPATSGEPPEEVTMDTEAALLRSGEVLRRLAETGRDTGDPRTLRERVSLTVPRHTRVLVVEFSAPTPEGAKAGAEILADTFLEYRRQLLTGRAGGDLDSLRERISALQGQLDSLSGAGGDGDDAAAVGEDTASARRQDLTEQIEDLQEQLAAAEDMAADPGQLVRAPDLPQRPDETNDEVTVASSVGAALLAGLALGLVRDRVPQRVRSVGDVTRRTGLPVLAEVHHADTSGSLAAHRTRTAYRRLYNVLNQDRVHSVLVTAHTSTLAETVATGLAAASAQAGKSTTLLLTAADGGARAGARRSLPPAVEVATILPRHLQDERLVARVVDLATIGDAQLVIAGPVLSSADVLPLGARAEGVVVVAERGRTRDRELAAGYRSLDLAGAVVRGVALARAPRQGALTGKKVQT